MGSFQHLKNVKVHCLKKKYDTSLNYGQDDDLTCGHSVSLVLPPGTVYQQTL